MFQLLILSEEIDMNFTKNKIFHPFVSSKINKYNIIKNRVEVMYRNRNPYLKPRNVKIWRN